MAGEARLRVMIVVDSMAPGGTEISIALTLPLLRERGIDPQIVILKSLMPDRGEAAVRRAGFRLDNLSAEDSALRAARTLRPMVRRARPDLIHASLFAPTLASAVSAIGTGIPVLTSIVNTPPEVHRNRPVETAGAPWKVRSAALVERFVCRNLVTHIHAVTSGVHDSVIARYRIPPERVTVAERGRDGSRFGVPTTAERLAARESLGLDLDDEVLVSLARQEPQKGLLDLVTAVEIAVSSRPRIKALLAGRDGSDTPALKDRLSRSPARDNIRLLGDRSDPELLLAAADAFVLSSRREGASGATIEAMAVGVPVIATDVAGLRGITVDGLNARVVPPGSPDAFAAGICEVLEDPILAKRIAAGGREWFEARFTLDHAADALASLYWSVAFPEGRSGLAESADCSGVRRSPPPRRAASVRSGAAKGVTRVLGSRPISASWRNLRPGLRILAYHGVANGTRFTEHLDMIQSHYTPVSGAQVVQARRNGTALPDDAVWITFDDGDTSVIAAAQPVLEERGIPATLFVCPGLIADRSPPWWEVVLAAGARGHGAAIDGVQMSGPTLVTQLKEVDDGVRRDVVTQLADRVGRVDRDTVVTLDHVVSWQQAGLELGNHSWDHPCLNRCAEDEQTRQIEMAHEWLEANLAPHELLFAYPNGDRTDHSHALLREMGYEAILLFDHRMNNRAATRDRNRELSRLRLDAWVSVARASAIVAGVHADVFQFVN